MQIYVNIGSNLGNPRENIARAISLIRSRFGRMNLSHAVESEPWGFDSANRFVNIGLCFETEANPFKVLSELQKIEREIYPKSHRNADGSYADRLIDIDIMAIFDGDRELRFNTESLTLPHSHLRERSFFLNPMRELRPGY